MEDLGEQVTSSSVIARSLATKQSSKEQDIMLCYDAIIFSGLLRYARNDGSE